MLTKKDLESIGKVVDQRIDKRLDTFTAEIDKSGNKRFEAFGAEMDKNMDKRFEAFGAEMDKKLKPIKSDTRKIKKDLKVTTDFFDRDIVSLKKRTKRIENHLGLPPVSVA